MSARIDSRLLLAALAFLADVDCLTSGAEEGPLVAASRCVVREDADGWWLVTPSGERFFSVGVCMFNQGASRQEYDPQRPSYAALRHYAAPEAWAEAGLARLRSWGFTTVGGWSDYHILSGIEEQQMWLTPVLHLGSTTGLPWFDMWDADVLRRLEEVADANMGPLRGNRRILGYYSDNELGWWNAILWKMTLEQPATSGQRQRLVKLVRERYGDNWSALLSDFEPEGAGSWQELEQGGMLWLRPGSSGVGAVRQFLALAAERYYELMREAIGRRDPGVLYLGDRYQSFYYPEVVRASGRHVDVVSTNLNASWNDGTFLNSYLATLHELSGKAVMVSEFYMAAEENRSGNPNASGGFPLVTTQAERAAALTRTLGGLARLRYVVGADWFQYYDEPPHGREQDGEDYNFGLVDIHDLPYEEVTSAFRSLKPAALKTDARQSAVNGGVGVPPAPDEPFAHFDAMGAMRDWDRERGFVPSSSEHPIGDLYACWSPEALYLGTYVQDIVEPDYYRDGQIPEVDRARWRVRIDGRDVVSARVGGGLAPSVSAAGIRAESVSGTYHRVRCITVIELPAERLGKQRLAPGDRIELDTSFETHARAERIEWRSELTLAE